ncbi:hypothetical protein [Nostoc sp. CCY0012]|uniref:hypothetical protein n=1 Tax=Nostoc sp. CCY0012 TaxID=1056123 RepID=UPI0039C6988D
MQIHISTETKTRLANFKYAIPNKLIEDEEAERRRPSSTSPLTKEELIKIFDRVWEHYIHFSLENAQPCEAQFAFDKIGKPYCHHVDYNQEHRSFRIHKLNLEFIAQLKILSKDNYELTQLWFVSSKDYNPECMPICFKDVEEKKKFQILAQQLNIKDSDLILELIRDFMRKHPYNVTSNSYHLYSKED